MLTLSYMLSFVFLTGLCLKMETQRLLFLAGLLLSSSQTEADVVNSVSDCAQFFLSGNPPQIQGVLKEKNILDQNRYKPIFSMKGNPAQSLFLSPKQISVSHIPTSGWTPILLFSVTLDKTCALEACL